MPEDEHLTQRALASAHSDGEKADARGGTCALPIIRTPHARRRPHRRPSARGRRPRHDRAATRHRLPDLPRHRRTRPGIRPRRPGRRDRPRRDLLPRAAADPLHRRVLHAAAQPAGEPRRRRLARSRTRRRIGVGRRRRRARADRRPHVGGRRGARRHRRAARRHRGDGGRVAPRSSATVRDNPGGREPPERRGRAHDLQRRPRRGSARLLAREGARHLRALARGRRGDRAGRGVGDRTGPAAHRRYPGGIDDLAPDAVRRLPPRGAARGLRGHRGGRCRALRRKSRLADHGARRAADRARCGRRSRSS